VQLGYEQRRLIEKLRLKLRRVRYAKAKQNELLHWVGFGGRFGLIDPNWLTGAFQKAINDLGVQEKDIMKKIQDVVKPLENRKE